MLKLEVECLTVTIDVVTTACIGNIWDSFCLQLNLTV